MNQYFRLNPAKLVNETIEGLSPRLKEVVILRFGLNGGKHHTLEATGQKFGITRERVRQIQNDAFDYLSRGAVVQKIKPLFEALGTHLDVHGGVRKESTILENDLVSGGSTDLNKPEHKAAVYFALNLGQAFNRHLETDKWHTFWTNQKNTSQLVNKLTVSLVDYFESKKAVLDEAGVNDFVGKFLAKQGGFKNPTSERIVNAYFGLIKPITKNIYREYGLRKWSQINPAGVRDKAYLVFRKSEKPMHFKEVAQAINQAGFSNKSAHPQTVHNELIKDPRFVLIGRGMYALKEWGYMPGTVKDVLVHTLKKIGKPLTKTELLDQISKQRVVKSNTVALNLQNKNYFKKTSEGRYTLV